MLIQTFAQYAWDIQVLCLSSTLRWPRWPSGLVSPSMPQFEEDQRSVERYSHQMILRHLPAAQFDRKQYFYADLPKGYQISQYDEPVCEGGFVESLMADGSKRRYGVTRAHLEEDAGKTVYGGAASLSGSEYSLVDYNRAGVPLLEIVSEPDMRSGSDAYGRSIQPFMVLQLIP